MRNRVLAVLAAVALIVGAVLLRGVLDDDDGDDGTEVVTDTTSAPPPAGAVICIEELREACAEIDGATVEAAGDTMDRLSADDAELPSVWVTFAPLDGSLDEARRVRGLSDLFESAERVATTPLVLVARADRGEVLETKCGDVTWKCLGDNASASWESLGGSPRWGDPKFGHEAPDQTAAGAIVFGWAAASYFDEGPIVLNDDAFRTWLTQLEAAVQDSALTGRTPLEQMVSLSGSLDVVGTTAVEAGDLIEGPRINQFTIYPSEVARAEVVIATTGAAVPDDLVEDLRGALTAAGWESADGASDGTVDGLPDGRTTEALRTLVWPEVS